MNERHVSEVRCAVTSHGVGKVLLLSTFFAALALSVASATARPQLAAFGSSAQFGNLVEPIQFRTVVVGGSGSLRDRWTCIATSGGTTYKATDSSETQAERKLIEYGLSNIRCRHSYHPN